TKTGQASSPRCGHAVAPSLIARAVPVVPRTTLRGVATPVIVRCWGRLRFWQGGHGDLPGREPDLFGPSTAVEAKKNIDDQHDKSQPDGDEPDPARGRHRLLVEEISRQEVEDRGRELQEAHVAQGQA